MQVINKKMFALLVFLIFPSVAGAATYPNPVGFVNDFAKVLDPQTNTQLTNILSQFEKKSGNEITVATIQSLEDEPIENYAVELYKRWGIGKKGQDNGALILVAPNDRQLRIEVGYGLEPYINDALAGRIIRQTMIPHFRENNFSLGILNGAIEVVNIISKKTDIKFDPIAAGAVQSTNIYHVNESATEKSSLSKLLEIIFVIFIILLFIKNPWAALFILSSFGGGGRGGSFRGGFGGGFSGFGGGLSGGGGSSGRW